MCEIKLQKTYYLNTITTTLSSVKPMQINDKHA